MPSKPPIHRPPAFKSTEEVKRELDRERPSAARRGYDARWRRARRAFLVRHPLCESCRAKSVMTPATVVDHREPHRVSAAVFWDEGNWQGPCKRCHDAKTAREGRWG